MLFTMRLDEDVYTEWQRKAAEAGLSVSAWVRGRCNEAKVVQSKGTEDTQARFFGRSEVHERTQDKPVSQAHDKKCQCGVCEFRRKALNG